MKSFHSYGPVNSKYHFCVDREEIVTKCINQLIGIFDESGYYFTIWAPRQTGKTWLLRQCVKKIKNTYGDQFIIGDLSMQSFTLTNKDDPDDIFFKSWQDAIYGEFNIDIGQLNSWDNWLKLFKKNSGLFEKPLILLIDEFDKLPGDIIDKVVSMFRHIYLKDKEYMLHGLALVGVRAVLGVNSTKGSPFNIQRSLHIPNLTFDETIEMFNQYQEESGQEIESQVIKKLYETTNGQPGLIGWFGELLTEKYNFDSNKKIDMDLWSNVYARSSNVEHNNTVQNIIAKARNEYKPYVFKLFKNSDIPFSFDTEWCNYMYMHGLITYAEIHEKNEILHTCRFSSSFIQSRLYKAFIEEVSETQDEHVLALEPLDLLEDVFEGSSLNLPPLLQRYKAFLERLKNRGVNPWRNQPRRKTDLHLTEAVGHFHLYYWLQMALSGRCSIIPEFPTGNGKVDLHLICDDDKKGLIEVKSFVNAYKIKDAVDQAAKYAAKTDYKEVTIAMFAPFTDENVLKQISVQEFIYGVTVNVVAIGQG
ncbi:ATPase domain protein, prokaryote domain protein [Candidatus Magnetomorum sp. HK-1]|nr:ATPase domain protein, prokaryote domain protein [Candidatus Magnetomorum sp. HK-1]